MTETKKERYKIIERKTPAESELQMEVEVGIEPLKEYRQKVVASLKKRLEIPGFRKGFAPEPVIVSKVGEMSVLEETAEEIIKIIAPEILRAEKIGFIGQPEIVIKKLAVGNPLVFSLKITLSPKIILPDYKKIAKGKSAEKMEIEPVQEKEVDEVVEQVRKNFNGNEADKTRKRESDSPAESKEKTETVLPPLDDDFVKKVGDFKDVAHFKNKIKENLTKERDQRAREKKRLLLVNELVKNTKVKVPAILVENELDKMTAQFRGDIERMGLKFDDYLKHLKKNEKDIKKEWLPEAEKRTVLELLIREIALAEKIEPAKELVEEELKHILDHYKNADPERARAYVLSFLKNEKVFEFLENQ